MNNKEFINALKLRRRFSLSLSAPFNEGYRGGINFAIDLATKIDEPEKEVIPQDVADFIEDGNRYDKIAFLVHQKYLGVNSLMRECPVKDWLRSVDYKTVLSLVNGYEVEKEPVWVVVDSDGYRLNKFESAYGNSLNWAYDTTNTEYIEFGEQAKAEAAAILVDGTCKILED